MLSRNTQITRLLVGDIVLGTPAAVGNVAPFRDCNTRYLGVVVGLTPLLTHPLDSPAPTILYEQGVYERFTCEFFCSLHDITDINIVELAGYKMQGHIQLLYDYDRGVFDRAFCETVREQANLSIIKGG
jgi:hypothetical protein